MQKCKPLSKSILSNDFMSVFADTILGLFSLIYHFKSHFKEIFVQIDWQSFYFS